MGPIDQLIGMNPGMKAKGGVPTDIGEQELVRIEAIIRSMTLEERRSPNIIDGSRRRRIAAGSGTSVQDINRLLNRFQQMKKMMKRMSKITGALPSDFPMS